MHPHREAVLRLNDGKRDHEVVFNELAPNDSLYVTLEDDGYLVAEHGNTFVLTESRASGTAGGSAGDGAIVSPMPAGSSRWRSPSATR